MSYGDIQSWAHRSYELSERSKAMSDLWFSEWKKMSVERRANWQKKEFAHRSKRSLNLKERAFWEVRSLSDVTMAQYTPYPAQNIVCFFCFMHLQKRQQFAKFNNFRIKFWLSRSSKKSKVPKVPVPVVCHQGNLAYMLSSALLLLRKSKNYLSTKALKSLYYSLFPSVLIYCIQI